MNRPAQLYACVYVREFSAQALLRLRPELHDQRCVVLDGEPPMQTVCALNTRARLHGLRRGMTRVEVDTYEGTTILQRSLRTEHAVRLILLECAGSFSPRIEDCSSDGIFLCALDIGGTENLFGPPSRLAKQLRQRVRTIGIKPLITVSANLHTAICLAKVISPNVSLQVISPGEEAEALSNLPFTVLDMTEAQKEIFQDWGIRTLGTLAVLPETSLVSRLGQDGRRLLQLARGERSHLFNPISVPFVLEEYVGLDFPLDDMESLLFGLSTMLEQLILRAASRVYALATVTLTLHLDRGGRHTRTVNPRVPTNQKQLWLKLIQLDLENHPPQDPAVAVHLYAEPGIPGKVQLGLFSPQLPEPGRLDVTLARITSLVGDGNVGQAVLEDTHRMSDFHIESFCVPPSEPLPTSYPPRLCFRVLRPAEQTTVVVRSGRPIELYFRTRRYTIQELYGPWLGGGDWWNEEVWGNEQWDVVGRATDSSFLACRLARDFVQNNWRVTGLYD